MTWGKKILAAAQSNVLAKCYSSAFFGPVFSRPIWVVIRFLRTAILTDNRIKTSPGPAEIMTVCPPALDKFELILYVCLVADK